MALVDSVWYVNFGDGSTTGYYAVTRWATGATIAAGALRRQNTAPAVGNERVFVCIVAGTTHATTEPTWVLTRGAKTTDNTVTWMECSGQAALNGDLTNTATWAQVKAATPAVLGQIIKRSNNASYQICTTAGAMSASEPAFSDTAGVTTTDTTAVWTSLGAVSNFTGGQAPHARLVNALAATWFAGGNTVYVGDNHAEVQSATLTISTNISPLMARVLCHNHSGSYPPAASDLTTGATLSTTGVFPVNIGPQGSFYFYGLAFIAGVGGSSSGQTMSMGAGTVSQVQNWYYFDNCSFVIAATGGTCYFMFGPGQAASWLTAIFNNTTIKFASTTQYLQLNGIQLLWQNTGQILAAGSVVPNSPLLVSGALLNTVVLEALDLSQLTGNLINPATGGACEFTVKDCKLNASTAFSPLTDTALPVQLIRCDSGATAYKSTRYAYEGTESTETSIVRSGGAVDANGQAQSRKIVTTANTQWLRPFKAEPYLIWNATVGSPVNVTVCGTINAGALPLNDDIWLELEYLGDAGLPSSFATLDGTPTNTTLSNGNLTATHSNTTGDSGARSTTSKTSGKYYFEATYNTTATAGDCVGIIQTAETYGNMVTNGRNCSIAFGAGIVYTSDGQMGGPNMGAMVAGDKLSVAVDLTAAKCWFRRNGGAWNSPMGGSPDPVTGVNGGTIETPSVGYVPVVGFTSGGSGNQVTLNLGASAFAYAVPSGYTAGWDTPAVPTSPLGKFATSGKANVWNTGAAVPSDSSTWSLPAYSTLDGTPESAVAMSNGNLTATHGNTGNCGVQSLTFLSTGKYYFEVVSQVQANTNNSVGITRSVGTLSADVVAGSRNCVSAYGNTPIWVDGVDSGFDISGTNLVLGDVFGVAVDLTNRLCWFRKNGGNWNNNASYNPVTGVGGVGIPTGSWAPYVHFVSGALAACVFTANFGQSGYAFTAPSGFGNWYGWSPFKLTAAITPQLPGYIQARVRAAKLSTTFYLDPQIRLS